MPAPSTAYTAHQLRTEAAMIRQRPVNQAPHGQLHSIAAIQDAYARQCDLAAMLEAGADAIEREQQRLDAAEAHFHRNVRPSFPED